METWLNGRKQSLVFIQGKICNEVWKGGEKVFKTQQEKAYALTVNGAQYIDTSINSASDKTAN